MAKWIEPARPVTVSSRLVAALTALGLAAAVFAAVTVGESILPSSAAIAMLLWLVVSLACAALLAPINFTAGFLGGLFSLLAGWRIAGLLGVDLAAFALLPAFVAYVLQFFEVARADRAKGASASMTLAEWHGTFLRIYLGFDMVPHFTEKLFAGPAPYQDDVKAFEAFGLPLPGAFVIVGGLCEIATAIGIGMGLLTRLAALGATLYFMIATVVGGHFGLGFIWASPGGGWEYPVLMMVLYLSFAVVGGGRFTLDAVLQRKGWLPDVLKPFARVD